MAKKRRKTLRIPFPQTKRFNNKIYSLDAVIPKPISKKELGEYKRICGKNGTCYVSEYEKKWGYGIYIRKK